MMRRATGRPDHHRLPRLLPRRVDHDRGARRRGGRDLERAARPGPRLRPRALPAPLPHAVPRAATRRHRRRDRGLHPRPRPLPRRRPRRRGWRRDRAGAGLGRLRRAAGLVLAGADRSLPRARMAALRRRGEDRDGPRRAPVRGRALGRRARPHVPRQGARRRRDADRCRCWGPSACSAASTTCRPAAPGPGSPAPARRRWRRSTSTPPSRCSRTSPRSRSLATGRLGELRERFERIGDVRAVGCFQAIEFVRDRETAELDCRAPARGRGRDAAPRRARRLLDHLDQHPAVADHAGSGARPGLRDRRGLDRGGARGVRR